MTSENDKISQQIDRLADRVAELERELKDHEKRLSKLESAQRNPV